MSQTMQDPWAGFIQVMDNNPAPAASSDPWAGFVPVPDQAAPPNPQSLGERVMRRLGGMADNTARTLARGASMGFADELAAAGNATVGTLTGQPGTWSERYDQNLSAERARDAAFDAQNPVMSAVGQFGGAVLTPMGPLGRMASGAASVPGAMVRGAGIGAGLGAVSGFGEGQGGFENRISSATRGAAFGAAVGGTVPAAISAGSALGGAVGRQMGVANPAASAERILLRDLSRDGITPEQLVARAREAGNAPVAIADLGGENVAGAAQAVSRLPGRGQTAAREMLNVRGGAAQGERLESEVRRAFRVPEYSATIEELRATRSADARPLYERAFSRRLPEENLPRAAEFIADPIGQDALQRGLRVIELEHLAAGTRFDPAAYGVRRVGGARGEAGSRAEFEIPPMPEPPQPVIRRLPGGGEAFDPAATARAQAQYDAAVAARQKAIDEAPADGVNAGRFVMIDGQAPNMRLLDAVKRGYDEIVESFRDPVSGRLNLNQYGNAVNGARASYVRVLDEMNPDYGVARAAWGEPSGMMDAMRVGRRLLSEGQEASEMSARRIMQMPDAERQAFRVGVQQALLDRLGRATDSAELTRLNQIFGTPAIRTRLRAAFDTQAEYDAFTQTLQREIGIARINRAVNPAAGSQTMPLGERRADLANPPVGPVASAMTDPARAEFGGPSAGAMRDVAQSISTGGLFGPVGRLMERGMESARAGALERNVDQLAPMLFTTDSGRRMSYAEALVARAQEDARRRALIAPAAQGLLSGGAISGGLLAN